MTDSTTGKKGTGRNNAAGSIIAATTLQTHLREDKAFIRFITSRRFLLWAVLLGAVHIFFMGYEGWLSPGGWHGGMPPISLVAFAFFVTGYAVNLLGRR